MLFSKKQLKKENERLNNRVRSQAGTIDKLLERNKKLEMQAISRETRNKTGDCLLMVSEERDRLRKEKEELQAKLKEETKYWRKLYMKKQNAIYKYQERIDAMQKDQEKNVKNVSGVELRDGDVVKNVEESGCVIHSTLRKAWEYADNHIIADEEDPYSHTSESVIGKNGVRYDRLFGGFSSGLEKPAIKGKYNRHEYTPTMIGRHNAAEPIVTNCDAKELKEELKKVELNKVKRRIKRNNDAILKRMIEGRQLAININITYMEQPFVIRDLLSKYINGGDPRSDVCPICGSHTIDTEGKEEKINSPYIAATVYIHDYFVDVCAACGEEFAPEESTQKCKKVIRTIGGL